MLTFPNVTQPKTDLNNKFVAFVQKLCNIHVVNLGGNLRSACPAKTLVQEVVCICFFHFATQPVHEFIMHPIKC